jgi:hypothetical protein
MASTLAGATAIMVDSPEKGIPGLYTGMIVWAFCWAFLDVKALASSLAPMVNASRKAHFS